MRLPSLRLAMAGATLLLIGTSTLTLAAGGGGGGAGVDATTGADLQISGSASTGAPGTGNPFTYSFKIKNSGPMAADGATFSTRLPDGVAFRDAAANGWSPACAFTAPVVSCALGALTGGTGTTVVVSVFAPSTLVTIADVGTVTSDVPDPKTANNSTTVTVTTKPGTVDTITVSKCYTNAIGGGGGQMLLNAASSDAMARLFAYRPDGSLIGEVQNGGGARYGGTVMAWQPYDPVTVTFRSTSGGSTTAPTEPFQL